MDAPARRGRKRVRSPRVRLPRFSQPFTGDVVIWRESIADGYGSYIRTNLARTCMQRSLQGFACGVSGHGASDLALNILNAYVPPRPVAVRRWGEDQRDDDPLNVSKGVASRFAIEHHQQFKKDFIVRLPADGGRIPIERIREWITLRRRPITIT